MKNFKIYKIDIALLTGFIFCCVGVMILAWAVNEPDLPKPTQPLTSTAWTNPSGTTCSYGEVSWPAKGNVCYMEDMPK